MSEIRSPSHYDWFNALHYDDVRLLVDALNRAVIDGRLYKFRLLRGGSNDRIGLVCSAEGCSFKAVLFKTEGWRGKVVDPTHTHPVAVPAEKPTLSSTDESSASDPSLHAAPSRDTTPTPSSTIRDESAAKAVTRPPIRTPSSYAVRDASDPSSELALSATPPSASTSNVATSAASKERRGSTALARGKRKNDGESPCAQQASRRPPGPRTRMAAGSVAEWRALLPLSAPAQRLSIEELIASDRLLCGLAREARLDLLEFRLQQCDAWMRDTTARLARR